MYLEFQLEKMESGDEADASFHLLDIETLFSENVFDECLGQTVEPPSMTQLLTIDTQELISGTCIAIDSKNVTPTADEAPVSSTNAEKNAEYEVTRPNDMPTVPTKIDPPDSNRFGCPVSSQQIHERNMNSIPKKTRDANKWALKVWSDWAKFRNSRESTHIESISPIPEDIGALDDNMINYWGQRFVMEIKRQDGKEYPPNTLTQIVSGLQRYLNTVCHIPNINFFREGTQFVDFRRCLDTRMKELHAQGIGIKTNAADPVTIEDEVQLWRSGVFNFDTAVGLSNAVFYYNGKLFGFRGFQEHVNCQADQFEILKDSVKDLRYIKFTPGLRKNSQGGLKSRNGSIKPIIHYEQKDREYSIVYLYDLYLSLIPRVGAFYRKPTGSVDENGSPKFGAATIAQNAIKSMIKRFYTEAGIDMTDRKISNHSARVALCTTLYNKNFPDKAVMSRSKHKSNAVQSYQREQFEILNDISNALEPNLTKLKREEKPSPPSETLTYQDAKPINQLCDLNNKNLTTDEEALVINVPDCVKKIVIVKKDGKKMIIEV